MTQRLTPYYKKYYQANIAKRLWWSFKTLITYMLISFIILLCRCLCGLSI